MESYLITIEDVSAVRKISRQINEVDFSGRVIAVQRRNLLNLLGNALYTDLMDNLTDVKYTDLINGKKYLDSNNKTITYFGLKPFLSWHLIAGLLSDGSINYQDLGITKAEGENFTLANPEESLAARKEAFSDGTNYENNIIDFLDSNTATYTLWESKNKAEESDIYFNFL
jgi:hypothetical protein